jgi:hypothetical protein
MRDRVSCFQLLLGIASAVFKFKLYRDRHLVTQFVLVSGPYLGPTTRFVLLSDICGLRIVGAPSLTRGQSVNYSCKFAVTLRSKSCRTQDHILPSNLKLPQPGGPGYIPQEHGGPVIPHRHWVPFLSPLMIHRAMVEVF